MASLRGRIIEFYTGRSVAGALVVLDGQTAIADANGYFTFLSVPPRSYTLQITHRDFKPYATALNLSQNMAYNLPEPIKVMSVVRAL